MTRRLRVALVALTAVASFVVAVDVGESFAANSDVDAFRAVVVDPQTARTLGLRIYVYPIPVRLDTTDAALRRHLKKNGFTHGVHVTYAAKAVLPGSSFTYPDGKVAEISGAMFDFRSPQGAERATAAIVRDETSALKKAEPGSLRRTQNQAVQVVGLDEANLITIAHVTSDDSGRSDLVILTGRHGRAVFEFISDGLHLDDATIAAQVSAIESIETRSAQAIDAASTPTTGLSP